MKDHYVEFMETMFKKGHAEIASPLEDNKECWYLPSFGIYHSQKIGKIRIVFDSSGQYNISLNQVLFKGPDLNNSLTDVIIRLRSDSYAVMVDTERMFHIFLVKEEHCDYFLWFQDHNLDRDICGGPMFLAISPLCQEL